jgi:hypothetical protein
MAKHPGRRLSHDGRADGIGAKAIRVKAVSQRSDKFGMM